MNVNALLWVAAVLFTLWHFAKLMNTDPRRYKPI
jgi:hypothetical protein